jgi:hypothetical protein
MAYFTDPTRSLSIAPYLSQWCAGGINHRLTLGWAEVPDGPAAGISIDSGTDGSRRGRVGQSGLVILCAKYFATCGAREWMLAYIKLHVRK